MTAEVAPEVVISRAFFSFFPLWENTKKALLITTAGSTRCILAVRVPMSGTRTYTLIEVDGRGDGGEKS